MQDLVAWFLSLTVLTQTIVLWFVVINIITFFVYGFDKMMAVSKQRRVSEKTMWILALIGGSLGAICAMEYFRHKTKKISFFGTLVLILLLQLAGLYLIVM